MTHDGQLLHRHLAWPIRKNWHYSERFKRTHDMEWAVAIHRTDSLSAGSHKYRSALSQAITSSKARLVATINATSGTRLEEIKTSCSNPRLIKFLSDLVDQMATLHRDSEDTARFISEFRMDVKKDFSKLSETSTQRYLVPPNNGESLQISHRALQ